MLFSFEQSFCALVYQSSITGEHPLDFSQFFHLGPDNLFAIQKFRVIRMYLPVFFLGKPLQCTNPHHISPGLFYCFIPESFEQNPDIVRTFPGTIRENLLSGQFFPRLHNLKVYSQSWEPFERNSCVWVSTWHVYIYTTPSLDFRRYLLAFVGGPWKPLGENFRLNLLFSLLMPPECLHLPKVLSCWMV